MYLDVTEERVQPHDWKIRIDGLEVFEPYIQAHQRALYDNIRIANIRDAASALAPYDLVIAGDVIEHLDKNDGKAVLRVLYEKAQKALLVNIPLGAGWDHGVVHGNPDELHRSQWECEDFLPYPNVFQEFRAPFGGRYGVFYCPKDCPKKQRVEGLGLAAALCLSREMTEEAAIHLADAHAIAPENAETAGQLADLLLKQHQIDEAVAVLDRSAGANPQFHFARLAAARVLVAVHRYSEAESRLESLLQVNGLEPALRERALQAREEARRKRLRDTAH
jgi:tetratricopeptide (TPR) repeat protein